MDTVDSIWGEEDTWLRSSSSSSSEEEEEEEQQQRYVSLVDAKGKGGAKKMINELLKRHIPSAGKVTIKFVYDGSLLAASPDEGRVVVNAWSSLNRKTSRAIIEWQKCSSEDSKSREATVTLDLRDEYEYAAAVRAGDHCRYELGNLRTDSNVWFEALLEEPSVMTRQAVYGRNGGGFVSVADLVDLSRRPQGGVDAQLPLVLFGTYDKKQHNVVKGALHITSVSFGDDTERLQKLASKQLLLTNDPSRFELNTDNVPFLTALNDSSVTRTIFDVTTDDKTLVTPETRPPNNRIRMPWYQTHQPVESLNRLPLHAYFLDVHALNPLPSDTEEDEAYLLKVFGYAFKRQNMSLKSAAKTMKKQLASKALEFDPEFGECVTNIARGFCLVSNTFPYQSDTRNLSHRVDRLGISASKAQQQQNVDTESLDMAQRRGGGDCEDLARYVKAHYDMLIRGKWQSDFLQQAQQVASMYDVVMMLGSVTSPALGNEHDAEKTAAHLADAEYHDFVLSQGDDDKNHMTRSEEVRKKHKHSVLGSKADLNKPVGGHSWTEMIPKHKIAEWIRRTSPETADATHSKVMKTLEQGCAANDALWKYQLSHFVLEGTGRINPRFMPGAYYCAEGQDRNAVRRAELAHLRTFHALISTSPVMHSMQSEAQPTSTVNTPFERLTDFYVQSTQMFSTAFLQDTGVVAFEWVQLKPGERAVDKQVDPLFAKTDALKPENIDAIKSRYEYVSSGDKPPPPSQQQQQQQQKRNVLLSAAADDTKKEMREVAALVGVGAPGVATKVEPKKMSIGVDLEQRILDRPMADNIALRPIGALTRVEAMALASQMRQVCPAEKPSSKLSMFPRSTANPATSVMARQSIKEPNKTEPTAMARLVFNKKLARDQRQRLDYIETHVSERFASIPWLSRKACARKALNLQTFFFAPHDLVDDKAPVRVVDEVLKLQQAGIVHSARFYVEEAVENFKTAVLQLQCHEVMTQNDTTE